MNHLITFLSAALGGGLLVFFQFLIIRHDNKKGHNAAIQEKLDALAVKVDTAEIKSIRRQILKFDHEIRHGERHTKDEWETAIDDVTEYKRYCRLHSEFVNDKCNIAIETIIDTYKKVKSDNDFDI